MNVLWIVLIALALALVGWFAFRTDPHWVARDGKAFTCRIQYLDGRLAPVGRWREARAFLDGDCLVVRPRHALRRSARSSEYRILKRAENPPRHLVTFLIDRTGRIEGTGPHGTALAVFRVPSGSRALPHIEAAIASA